MKKSCSACNKPDTETKRKTNYSYCNECRALYNRLARKGLSYLFISQAKDTKHGCPTCVCNKD